MPGTVPGTGDPDAVPGGPRPMGNMKQVLSSWRMPLRALLGRGMRNLERLLEGGGIYIGSDRKMERILQNK